MPVTDGMIWRREGAYYWTPFGAKKADAMLIIIQSNLAPTVTAPTFTFRVAGK